RANMSTQKLAASASRQINAVVVSAGLMEKTVKVRIGQQKWNAHIRKHFNRTSHLLVHDPASSLRIGDIISISPGWRASKHVHHVVNSILAPFGDPIEARPKVPSEEERLAMREAKRAAKEERRRLARIGERVEESEGEGERQA
ncbi:nucleic acid-binding protein, partial [Acephala macrosclerotiorum]